jgi:hypothetical protein
MSGGHGSQNSTAFEWTEERLRAAQLLAEDRLSDEDIAAECGVNRRTLATWKLHPDFKAKKAAILEEMERSIVHLAIAQRHKRVRILDDLQERYLKVLAARAADPELRELPGGDQGLVVKTLKVIGMGPNAQTVTEYEVDPIIPREVRALQEQAAKELGQWTEKKQLDLNGPGVTIYLPERKKK